MDKALVLMFGAPGQFQDGRRGRLTGIWVHPIDRRVYGVSLTWHGGGVFVPANLITAAFEDGIHFNLHFGEVPSAREIPGLELTGDYPVRREDAGRAIARLRGAIGSKESLRLRAAIVSSGLFGRHARLSEPQIASITSDFILLDAGVPPLRRLPRYRSDDEIFLDISSRIRLLEMQLPPRFLAVAAEVADGVVYLRGNVRSPVVQRAIIDRVHDATGTTSIRDELIGDQDLEIAVGAALGRQTSTRHLRVLVSSWTGEIQLDGEAPDTASAEEAVRVAAAVPGVRAAKSELTIGASRAA